MSVKHVCPNCGSTLTLDAPMPSLRCPKCKTTMQPEIATPAADTPEAAATPVARPMRVARTVSTIGPQPAATPTETERLLEEARFKAQQERDRLLVEANKQILQAKADAEASLQQLREQKMAEATEEANAIVETANQNAAKIQSDAESAAQQRLAEAESAAKTCLEEAEAAARKRMEEAEAIAQQQLEAAPTAIPPQTENQPDPAQQTAPQAVAPQGASLEEQKAKIDKLARQNQIRFWRLNAYVAIFILTLICAVKSNGNTLVAVLSSLAAVISVGLAAYAVYSLRSCIALLKAEQNGTSQPNAAPAPQPSIPRKTPSFKLKKEKPTAVATPAVSPADAEQAAEPAAPQDDAEQTADASATNAAAEATSPQPPVRRTLMPATKKKPAKPLFIKKKTTE